MKIKFINKNLVKIIIFTGIASTIIFSVSVFLEKKAVDYQPQKVVLKAIKTLNVGDSVISGDFKPTKMALVDYNSSLASNSGDIVGMIVKEPIYSGEDINTNRLISSNDEKNFVSNKKIVRFSIPTAYIDDPYSLTVRKGDVVNIIHTLLNPGNTSMVSSTRMILNAKVVGALDSDGSFIDDSHMSGTIKNNLAYSIIFEGTEDQSLKEAQGQYTGKYKFEIVPLNQNNDNATDNN